MLSLQDRGRIGGDASMCVLHHWQTTNTLEISLHFGEGSDIHSNITSPSQGDVQIAVYGEGISHQEVAAGQLGLLQILQLLRSPFFQQGLHIGR